MIMPRGQQLLLPVNPVFIFASLALALALNLLPLGPLPWLPDLVMVLLAFWGVHQPGRVGMGLAFALGLCMDVGQSSLLGQHALAYTLVMFATRLTHRRLLWFRPGTQALQMLGPFAVNKERTFEDLAPQALQVLIGLLSGGLWPGWWLLCAPLLEALLWPLASWALLAPQRRPPDPDGNRPL